MLQTITWTGDAARLLDQTKLPTETVYVDITDEKQMWDAIKRLVVRGAPAIGVAAAFGVYLGVRHYAGDAADVPDSALDEVCDYLATSRPDGGEPLLGPRPHPPRRHVHGSAAAASPPCESSRHPRRAAGRSAWRCSRRTTASAAPSASTALNSSSRCEPRPATSTSSPTATPAAWPPSSTAPPSPRSTSATSRACEFHVFADETRPLLQGSRITAYELQQNGIPVTVICDNMAATVMSQGKVARRDRRHRPRRRQRRRRQQDRHAGRRDPREALRHPVLRRRPDQQHRPVAATGEADPDRAARRAGDHRTAWAGKPRPDDVDVYNPAFDVTPAELVTAIITEKGVVRPPYEEELRRIVNGL